MNKKGILLKTESIYGIQILASKYKFGEPRTSQKSLLKISCPLSAQ